MTVIELIELLQECDPEAEVRTMTQQNWPFENAISGIAVREDFAGEPCRCDHAINEPHEDGCPAIDRDEYDDGMAANDAFVVEGPQERYGDRSAWAVARS